MASPSSKSVSSGPHLDPDDDDDDEDDDDEDDDDDVPYSTGLRL